MTSGRFLGSTYRLQLNGLGFAGARALVPYLHQLGIETLYVSPVLAAAPGSTHGYDVIDPGRLDPALGSAEQFEALLDELGTHDMRILLDVVPNHMAAHPSNRWWWNTLRLGQASTDADTFDIDWSQHGGRVLVPVLSRPLSEACDDVAVRHDPDGEILELDGQRFPLAPADRPEAPIPDRLPSQHYRPAFWRLGDTAGNYRRFFNIDGLVGVRVEDPEVFDRTHGFILTLCADERVAGLRVDHIDGLWNPTHYVGRLTRALDARGKRLAVLVEKILDRDEEIDARWAVDGTTGYEFSDRAGGLFLEDKGCRKLSDLGSDLTGEHASFAELSIAAKREMLERTFVAQLNQVTRLAVAALDSDEPGHDLSENDVRRALTELTVSLDVYRTYLDGGPPSRADAATISRAVVRCKRGRLESEVERAVMLLAVRLLERPGSESAWLDVARRWQQLTGAVMAKGVEDTATYRYNGLLSHAEVGCDPDRASCRTDEFHRFVRRRMRAPAGDGLNLTSSHDSKRNEDARCRLAVLSEASDEWGRLVRRWHRRSVSVSVTRRPHVHDELFAYQSLLTLWPANGTGLPRQDLRRVQDYALKAAREAKRHTSWTEPNANYERTLRSFIARICHEEGFRAEMDRFVGAIAPAAASNSLALMVLKACTPGTPDFFQGTELFEATLTDPDNRRKVDFSTRDALLASLPAPEAEEADLLPQVTRMLADWPNGRLKLYVIRALLHLRRRLPNVFAEGSYSPLGVRGPRAENMVAWSRRRGRHSVVAMIPRLTLTHAGRGRFPTGPRVWAATTCGLPKGAPHSYVDIFTGRTVTADRGRLNVADALGVLPVAVLHGAA